MTAFLLHPPSTGTVLFTHVSQLLFTLTQWSTGDCSAPEGTPLGGTPCQESRKESEYRNNAAQRSLEPFIPSDELPPQPFVKMTPGHSTHLSSEHCRQFPASDCNRLPSLVPAVTGNTSSFTFVWTRSGGLFSQEKGRAHTAGPSPNPSCNLLFALGPSIARRSWKGHCRHLVPLLPFTEKEETQGGLVICPRSHIS